MGRVSALCGKGGPVADAPWPGAVTWSQVLEKMVGVTGIEPVTPTMSTLLPYLNSPELREKSTTPRCIFGIESCFVPSKQVHCAKEHYVPS